MLALAAYPWIVGVACAQPPAKATNKAGETVAAEPEAVTIADEPKTIDPATLVPQSLAKRVKVRFDESPLREVVIWLQAEHKFNVVVNTKALNSEGVFQNEPVTDELRDEPIYLLLDRLRSLGVGWYLDNGRLYLTTKAEADHVMRTVTYQLSDLLDQGFRGEDIRKSIGDTTNKTERGEYMLLRDVLFVKNQGELQRTVGGVLAALRKHGRRTFVDDLPIHSTIREKLNEPVTVRIRELPLTDAAKQLATMSGIDIRIDKIALKAAKIRERSPVTIEVTGQRLDATLEGLLSELGLSWIVRDGVLWITTQSVVESTGKVAVFDIRDLCKDEDTAIAIRRALRAQIRNWDNESDRIRFARPGTMVVRATEQRLQDVLVLLETYRSALRASKSRPSDLESRLVTHYYKVSQDLATDLVESLPAHVATETWKAPNRDSAYGTIKLHASEPEAIETESESDRPVILKKAVLVIRTTPEVHTKIADYIHHIRFGDVSTDAAKPFVTTVIPIVSKMNNEQDDDDAKIFGAGGGMFLIPSR